MFVHQFTIGKIIVSNGISLNIGVVVRNTSSLCTEVSLFLVGQLQSQYWAQKRNGPVYMIWFQYTWPTLIIINLSVFLECLSCCVYVSQKKSALGASTMRGPCVSLLSAAHRGRPPLTPWYTGTQQLGPLGGAGRWHQQRRLFPALHNAHTLFFLLPWRCEWAEKVCLSRWNEKANIKLCNNFFSFRLIS